MTESTHTMTGAPFRRAFPLVRVLALVGTVAGTASTLAAQGGAPAAPQGAAAPAPQVFEALSWPKLFPARAPGAPKEPWKEATIRVGRLEIRLPHPPVWIVGSDLPAVPLIAHAADWSRAFSVTQPIPATFEIGQMSRDRLLEFARAMSGPKAVGFSRTLLAVGQTRTADGTLWVWLEWDVPPGAVAPGLDRIERMAFESARIWTFAATKAGHMVTVNCDVLIVRGTPDRGRQDRLADAGADCAHMLSRVAANALP